MHINSTICLDKTSNPSLLMISVKDTKTHTHQCGKSPLGPVQRAVAFSVGMLKVTFSLFNDEGSAFTISI